MAEKHVGFMETLEGMSRRLDEIDHLVSTPEIASGGGKLQPLMRERGRLLRYVERYRKYRDVCRQAVGIRSIWDGNDRERFYCSLAGHLGDVVAQMNADLLAERVRHDTAPEPRAAMPVTASDWQGIRPEMARSLR